MQVFLVGGGMDSDGNLLSSVEKFSVDDATWTAADNTLPSARSHLAGIASWGPRLGRWVGCSPCRAVACAIAAGIWRCPHLFERYVCMVRARK